MPINLKNRIFDRFFTIFDKRQDQNINVEGKGTLERYVEVIGEDVDLNIDPLIEFAIENLLVAETLLDKYVIDRENSLGNNVLFLSSDLVMRKRIIRFWHRFVSIKGTIPGYEVLFAMLGITAVITEFFNTGGFDSATTFDSDTRPTFDSGECAPCTNYEITLTGPTFTQEIYQAILSVIEFNEPINAILIGLTYNGIDLLNITYNWSYDTTLLGQQTPVFINSGAVLVFNFEGNIIFSNTPVYVFQTSGTKTVDVYVDDFLSVTSVDLQNERISGLLDFSSFTQLTSYLLAGNLGLSSITFPSSGATIARVELQGSGLTSIDFSPLTSLGGYIDIGNNTSLSTLTFNTTQSANPTTFINVGRNALTAIDLRDLLFGFGAQIFCVSCASAITFIAADTVNTNTIFLVEVRFNLLMTLIDIRNLQGRIAVLNFDDNTSLTLLNLGTVVRPGTTAVTGTGCTSLLTVDYSTMPIKNLDMSGCTSLTGLTHVATPTPIEFYDLSGCLSLSYFSITNLSGLLNGNNFSVDISDCALPQTDVDNFLADLVNICVTQRGEVPPGSWTGRVISLDGSNAAPSASGLTDKTTLQNLGITVNTN